MTTSLPTIDELKQQAKRLRQAMADRGTPIAHGAALELLAQQHGARDWNTLSARVLRELPERVLPFAVGSKVSGRYLNQDFEGRVLSLAALPGGNLFNIAIQFDKPVDVVTFDSFSALRHRIRAQVDAKGISPRKTSNGLPHLVLAI
ncbi:glyoxalase superfamily protein [Rhizobium tubonense]|uniref:Glyoxalase-related protein domain-containing protein n=1 Tax=Rhizobium tubonense TaxID=484088 RepID=A0A2W4CWL2_9HYPH|nr:glyoxalase superfamily protein [Rhizobium tubonense]PZM17037.1 hypothetical protein CPY51_02010 [Rhizobium tubonense]